MIDSTQLASLQTQMQATMSGTAIIQRPTFTADSSGRQIPSFAAVGTVVCRLAPQGMQPWEKEDRVQGKVLATNVFTVAVPAGTDVRSTDRLSIAGTTYEVIAAKTRTLELERMVQCVVLA